MGVRSHTAGYYEVRPKKGYTVFFKKSLQKGFLKGELAERAFTPKKNVIKSAKKKLAPLFLRKCRSRVLRSELHSAQRDEVDFKGRNATPTTSTSARGFSRRSRHKALKAAVLRTDLRSIQNVSLFLKS